VTIPGYWPLLVVNFRINTEDNLFRAEGGKLKHITWRLTILEKIFMLQNHSIFG
jgi:hypothetical protein